MKCFFVKLQETNKDHGDDENEDRNDNKTEAGDDVYNRKNIVSLNLFSRRKICETFLRFPVIYWKKPVGDVLFYVYNST